MVPAKPVVDCEVRRQQPGAAARRFRRDLRSDLLRQRVHSPAARDGARVAPRAEACAQAGRLAVDLDIERREPRAARAVAAGRLRLLLPPIRGPPGLPDFYQLSFHTREYIEREWPKDFDLALYHPRGINSHQDVSILRKPEHLAKRGK